MAEPTAKEAAITRKESDFSRGVQVADYFLLIIPFGTSDLKPDLLEMNFPETKLLDLILGNVVIEDDHAAVLLRPISVTMPRLVSETASRTASGLMMPRYCRDIAVGL